MSRADAPAAPPTSRRPVLNPRDVPRFAIVLLFLVLVVLFGVLKPQYFLTWDNASTILFAEAVPIILVLAVLLPLVAGELDLSIGGIYGLSTIVFAWTLQNGFPLLLALLATLVVALVIGAVNALLVVYVGLDSFIATLATSTLSYGLALLISGVPLYKGFTDEIKAFGSSAVAFVPTIFWIGLVLAVLVWYVVEHTPFGRALVSVGTGREAAAAIGVPVFRLRVIAFLAGALLAAIAGVLASARLGAATPSQGTSEVFAAITAVFLGTTFSKRGSISVFGAVIALIALAVGANGLALIGSPSWAPYLLNGAALIAALIIAKFQFGRIARLS